MRTLIWLSLEIASKAKDQLGALLAVGIASQIASIEAGSADHFHGLPRSNTRDGARCG